MYKKREQIEQFVIDIVFEALEETLGISRNSISTQDDIIDDLKMNSDDVSSDFIPTIEEKLDLDIPALEWLEVLTVKDAINLATRYKMKQLSDG